MLSWVEVDEQRLRSNIQAFRRAIAPGTQLMVVVKANAYGHGLETAGPIAAELADWLGVNSLEEAEEVRLLGIEKPVLILGHTPVSKLDSVVDNGFRQVLYRLDVAEQLAASAKRLGRIAHAHVKLETGTHRQGVPLSELAEFAKALREISHLEIEGAYTHFANIEDTLDHTFAQNQLAQFRRAVDALKGHGVYPTLTHTAATSAAVLYPDTHFNMVRVGIGAYGIWPSRETQLAARERGRVLNLSPALTWKSRIAQIKELKAGDYVGYGLTYKATHPMKVAVVPVGYYDGYDRKLSNNGRALVHGETVSVIGRVAMNMTMFDVSDVPVVPDDEIVLLGHQGSAEIRVEDLAERIGTVGYEVVSRINPLIPRILV